jgi:Spy/CpxP family protein refolding chaperone
MKSIRFRLFVAALAVMMGAAIANSQTADSTTSAPPVRGPGFGMDHHLMGFFAKYLDVTDAQKTQMKAVLQKEHTTMQPVMQQERQLDQQLKQYVQGTFDEAKVQALVSQQTQTLVQLKVEETRIHSELYQLLTPDQRAKLKEFEANREARMQQRMQNAPASDSPSAAPDSQQ